MIFKCEWWYTLLLLSNGDIFYTTCTCNALYVISASTCFLGLFYFSGGRGQFSQPSYHIIQLQVYWIIPLRCWNLGEAGGVEELLPIAACADLGRLTNLWEALIVVVAVLHDTWFFEGAELFFLRGILTELASSGTLNLSAFTFVGEFPVRRRSERDASIPGSGTPAINLLLSLMPLDKFGVEGRL